MSELLIRDGILLTTATFTLIGCASLLSKLNNRYEIVRCSGLDSSILAKLLMSIASLAGRELFMKASVEGNHLWNMGCRSVGILGGVAVTSLIQRVSNRRFSEITFALSMMMIDNILWFPLNQKWAERRVSRAREDVLLNHKRLVSERLQLIKMRGNINDEFYDFENEYGYRAVSAIFMAKRFNVSVGDLPNLAAKVETYIKNIRDIPEYQGPPSIFDDMRSCQMKNLQKQMLCGKLALNDEQQRHWNNRVCREDLPDKDYNSHELVYFSGSG